MVNLIMNRTEGRLGGTFPGGIAVYEPFVTAVQLLPVSKLTKQAISLESSSLICRTVLLFTRVSVTEKVSQRTMQLVGMADRG